MIPPVQPYTRLPLHSTSLPPSSAIFTPRAPVDPLSNSLSCCPAVASEGADTYEAGEAGGRAFHGGKATPVRCDSSIVYDALDEAEAGGGSAREAVVRRAVQAAQVRAAAEAKAREELGEAAGYVKEHKRVAQVR